MLEQNRKRMQDARNMFEKKDRLIYSIKTEIIPCLVSLKTKRGLGSGFFQHTSWLVSNAHVLPSDAILESTTLTDFQYIESQLIIEQSFHRPSDKQGIPDVAIVNVKCRPGDNRKCLPALFSLDEAYKDSITFYIYFNQATKKYEIKYLNHSDVRSFPLRYKPVDNIDPQHGCSGAPVIEARVLLGREPRWQFRTVGVVYARCEDLSISSQDQTTTKLACAIPVSYDFNQILEIINSKELTVRSEQMVEACDSLIQDQETKEKRESLLIQYKLYSDKTSQLLAGYTAGETSMPVSSIDDAEPLVDRLKKQTMANQQRRAVDKSLGRTDQHSNSWDVMNVRALADHFPKLGGKAIFATCEHNFTSNKTIFVNPSSGWSIVYDKHGQYSTVHNEKGTYVALDGSLSGSGTESKYHFSNKPKPD